MQIKARQKETYLWILAGIILFASYVISAYLFQPYARQYPGSYQRINLILLFALILLLAPVMFALLSKMAYARLLLAYLIVSMLPLGFLFDVDALFFIPWAMELILSILSYVRKESKNKQAN